MTVCIACRIENHVMCKREPECDCGCVHEREFSPEQLAIIESAEQEGVEL